MLHAGQISEYLSVRFVVLTVLSNVLTSDSFFTLSIICLPTLPVEKPNKYNISVYCLSITVVVKKSSTILGKIHLYTILLFMKGIIFDCDGVLVDSEKWSCSAWLPVLRHYGITAQLPQIEAFLGRSDQALLDHFSSLGHK